MIRGFTVVEVLVTLVIMTTLLALGTVGVRSSMVNARDSERKQDIEILARGFERFYDKGGLQGDKLGSYPSYNDIYNAARKTPYSIGSTNASWLSPSGSGVELICIFRSPSGFWPTVPGCETPSNLTTVRTQISPDKYGYEAIQSNGAFCYGGPSETCSTFKLYWIEEVSGDLKIYKSKHQ